MNLKTFYCSFLFKMKILTSPPHLCAISSGSVFSTYIWNLNLILIKYVKKMSKFVLIFYFYICIFASDNTDTDIERLMCVFVRIYIDTQNLQIKWVIIYYYSQWRFSGKKAIYTIDRVLSVLIDIFRKSYIEYI